MKSIRVNRDTTPDEETDSKTESLQCKINIQVLISLRATFPAETLNIEREVKEKVDFPTSVQVEGQGSAFGTSGYLPIHTPQLVFEIRNRTGNLPSPMLDKQRPKLKHGPAVGKKKRLL